MSRIRVITKENIARYIKPNFFTRKTVHSDYCIIGYLDILGSTERIKSEDDSDESLNSVFNLYSATSSLIKVIKHAGDISNIRVRIFSDNIILLYPFKDRDLHRLKQKKLIEEISRSLPLVVALSAIFQIVAFAGLKWCIRGGITDGRVFNNGELIWGKGLVRAYDIENTEAKYPRIVIDEELINEFGINEDIAVREWCGVALDEDGKYYVDFVNIMGRLSESPEVGNAIYEMFEKNFAELESDNEKVLDKYRWFVKTYANSMNNPELLENYPNLKFNL